MPIAPVFLRLSADGAKREAQRVAVEAQSRRSTKKASWLDPQQCSPTELRLRRITAERVDALAEATARDKEAREAQDNASRNAAAELAAAMAHAGVGRQSGPGGASLAHSRANSRANSLVNTPRRSSGADTMPVSRGGTVPPSRRGSFDELGYHIDKVVLSEVEDGLQFTKVAGGAYMCSHTQERIEREAMEAEAERKRIVRAKLDADTAKAEADRKERQKKAEEAQRAMHEAVIADE